MLRHIRDGNTNLIHITVQAANRMGGARYAVLNINQPLFEHLKGYFVLFNLLLDQALLKVQGTTLQLGKVEGATKVLTGVKHGRRVAVMSGYCPVPQATKKKQFWATTTPTSIYTTSSAAPSYATSSHAFSRMSAIELFATTPGTPALAPSVPSSSAIGGGGAAAAWKRGWGGSSHSRGPATCTPYDDSNLTAAAPNHVDSDKEVNGATTAPKPSRFWYNSD
ncbi:hypothetical protein EDB89DRAFT_1917125 [Lactarius sanguifluus]|nr:hypothetical protein EDB89DRAFT_1917125 [Lactarius sanguifluus]